MVNLADFMSYLDSVCTGLDLCIPKGRKPKDTDYHLYVTRAKLLHGLVKKACIFSQQTQEQSLKNVFVNNPDVLLPEKYQGLVKNS